MENFHRSYLSTSGLALTHSGETKEDSKIIPNEMVIVFMGYNQLSIMIIEYDSECFLWVIPSLAAKFHS